MSRLGWARFFPERREGRSVRLAARGSQIPGTCACCELPAARSLVERRARDGTSLIVPYCETCSAHAAAAKNRALAATLASLLVGLALAAGLPLAWAWLPAVPYVLLVVLGASAPLLATAPALARPKSGHFAAGRAVWWNSDGSLACANPRWAAQLARHNQIECRVATLREGSLGPASWVGVGTALVVAPFFYWLHHPLVRIVNLNPARIVIFADGRRLVSVDPTSAESPAAGVELRVPAGRRRLEARLPNGKHVSTIEARAESAGAHLYAPGADQYCFWLETTRYGRAGGPTLVEPLSGQDRFWRLPSGLDTWFAPNPPASSQDRRSTGGALTALRQAPCAEAPAGVRRAKSTIGSD